MSGSQTKSSGSGCVFWLAVFPLVVAPVGTCVVVGVSHLRSAARAPTPDHAQVSGPEASDVVDARVQADGARICAAYRALARGQAADAVPEATALWKKLGTATAPDDPWGQPFEWQPWNRTVRSYGPDRARGTPDDQVVRCEG